MFFSGQSERARFDGTTVGFGSNNCRILLGKFEIFQNEKALRINLNVFIFQVCYYCSKTGHLNRDCPERLISNRGNGGHAVFINSDEWNNLDGVNTSS